jgi:hypothetical protein
LTDDAVDGGVKVRNGHHGPLVMGLAADMVAVRVQPGADRLVLLLEPARKVPHGQSRPQRVQIEVAEAFGLDMLPVEGVRDRHDILHAEGRIDIETPSPPRRAPHSYTTRVPPPKRRLENGFRSGIAWSEPIREDL